MKNGCGEGSIQKDEEKSSRSVCFLQVSCDTRVQQLTWFNVKVQRCFSVPAQPCLYNNDSALQSWLAARIEILSARAFSLQRQLHVCGLKRTGYCGCFSSSKQGTRSSVQLTPHFRELKQLKLHSLCRGEKCQCLDCSLPVEEEEFCTFPSPSRDLGWI